MKFAAQLQSVMKGIVSPLLAAALIAGYPGPARSAGDTIKDEDTKVVQLAMRYKIRLSGRTDSIRLVTLVPRTLEPKQKVLNIRYSIQPTRFFESDGNLYAEYVFADPRSDIDISIDADMALRRYDLSSAAAVDAKPGAGSAFLKSEPYLEKDDAAIVAIANSIKGNDEMDTIRKIYDYVTGTLAYKGYVSEDVGALRVLRERKYGDCSDFADAVVALARAKNIPARTVDGFLTEYSDNNPRHTWVEIYTDRFGWVPFDPLLGSLRQASFDRLGPKYIYLSDVRNDRQLNSYHFFACSYSGSPISVTDTYSVTPARDVMTLTQS